jgi:hypothetical protein
MQHAAIVQHRQVEAAAVPRNDLRREFLDAVEEALDDRAFARSGSDSDQTLRPSLVRSTQEMVTTRCRCKLQEIVAGFGPALLEGEFGDFVVGKLARQIVQPTQAGDIGNRLDVENQDRFHAGKTPVDR